MVDLRTTVRPGQSGYPLNATRDTLQDRARWAFSDVVEEVERENDSGGRSMEDEVCDPDSDDDKERRRAAEIGDPTAEAFADEAFQKVLAEASGGIADCYAERAKDPGVESLVASLVPAGSCARPNEDQPTRGAVLPPEMQLAVTTTSVENDVAATASSAGAARQLRAVLDAADRVEENASAFPGVVLTDRVVQALDSAEVGEALGPMELLGLQGAADKAAGTSLQPGGGELFKAATVS